MSGRIGCIGVLTGGGDAPGLNAVIRAVVKTAINHYNMRVLGIEDGFEGLLDPPRYSELGLDQVRGLLPRGGTILGTRNKGHFNIQRKGEEVICPVGVFEEAIKNLRELGIEALVTIGGDGTHAIAYEFHKRGFPVVGVPKTIDNDLDCTDLTFGFDTAVDIAVESIDRLHTTAESHDRVMLLEVMGRHAGWIAIYAGIAGGADIILIPEIPFYIDKIASKVLEREKQGRLFSIAVVAEGAIPVGGEAIYQPKGQLGGISYKVAEGIETRTGKDTRAVVLGHIQRGGQPTAVDRMLASCFGVSVVHLIAAGKFGRMIGLRDGKLESSDIAAAIAKRKTVPLDSFMLQVARDLGITFAGEED
jgi:ATP-dependent phosphofructokinase / diphosphate-dependent phosphofructokinase